MGKQTFLDGLLALDPASPEFGKKLAEYRRAHKAELNKTPDFTKDYNHEGTKQAEKTMNKQMTAQHENSKQDVKAQPHKKAPDLREDVLLSKMGMFMRSLPKKQSETDLTLLQLDAENLAESLDNMTLDNPDSPRIAHDLDKDLASIGRAKKLPSEIKKTYKTGSRVLKKFDQYAKKHGVKTPERDFARPVKKELPHGSAPENDKGIDDQLGLK